MIGGGNEICSATLKSVTIGGGQGKRTWEFMATIWKYVTAMLTAVKSANVFVRRAIAFAMPPRI